MEAKERGRKEPFIHLNNESFKDMCAVLAFIHPIRRTK